MRTVSDDTRHEDSGLGYLRVVSQAYVLIVNIRNAADDHVRRGCGPDCCVSLLQLRQACSTLKRFAEPHELAELDRLTAEWPS